MVVKKKYALRSKNGTTRVVQCHEGRKGLVYSSDRKPCGAKTYRNKTLAKDALSKRKSGYGRRRKKSTKKNCSFGRKKYKMTKYYAICHDMDDPEKVRKCRAFEIRLDGENIRIVKQGSGSDAVFYQILNDDVKLYKQEDIRSGKLNKLKKEYGLVMKGAPAFAELLPIARGALEDLGVITGGGQFRMVGGSKLYGKKPRPASSQFLDARSNDIRTGFLGEGYEAASGYHPSSVKGLPRREKSALDKSAIDSMKRLFITSDNKRRGGYTRLQQYKHTPGEDPVLTSTYATPNRQLGGSGQLFRSPRAKMRRPSATQSYTSPFSGIGPLSPSFNSEYNGSGSSSFGQRSRLPNALGSAYNRSRSRSRFGFGMPRQRVNYGFSRYF